jgi:hypothetical protein
MKTAVSSRISRCTAIFAVILTGLAFLFGGLEVGVGAAIGGLVAILNWAFVRWVGERVVRGRVRNPGLLSLLLALKLGLLGAVLFVLIAVLGVHPGGLALGLGSLVLGILVGSGVASSSFLPRRGALPRPRPE